MHQYGNNVVLACFIPSNRPPLFSAILLQCGLQAFSRLHGVQLAQLVQNNNARHVLHRLLQTSMTVSIRLSCHAIARSGRSIVT